MTERRTRSTNADAINWNNYDLIAFSGLAMLIVVPPFFRGLFFPEDQVIAMLWAAPLLAYVAWLAARRGERFFAVWPEVLAFLLPVAYLVSSFVAINPGLAVNEVVENTLYFIAFWVAVRIICTPNRANWLVAVVVATAAAVSLTGLAAPTGLIYIRDSFWGNRICSSFQYPNSLASYLAAAFLLGIYLVDKLNEKLAFAANLLELKAITNAEKIDGKAKRTRVKKEKFDKQSFGKQEPINGTIRLTDLWSLFILWTMLYIIALAFWGTQSQGGTLALAGGLLIFIFLYPPERRLTAILLLVQLLVTGYLVQEFFMRSVLGHRNAEAWAWVCVGWLIIMGLCWLNHKFSKRLSGRVLSTRVLFAIIVAAVLVGSVLIFANSQLYSKFQSFLKLRNAYERFAFIEYAVEMIKQRPLFGWGGGGWNDAYQYFFKHYSISTQVHSYYFQVAVETGLLGLVVVLAFLGSLAVVAIKLWQNRSEIRSLTAALIASIALMYGHAAIDFDLSLAAITITLMCLAGTLTGVHKAGNQCKIQTDVATMGKATTNSNMGKLSPNNTTIIAGCVLSLAAFTLAAIIATANSYASHAMKMIQAGRGQEALFYAQKAQSLYPLNANFDVLVAGLQQAAGDLNGAEKNLRSAVCKSWYSPRNHIELAKILVQQKKYKEAIDEAGKAISLAPLRMEVYEAFARLAITGALNSFAKSGRNEEVTFLAREVTSLPERMLARHRQLTEEQLRLSAGGNYLDKPSPVIMLAVGEAYALLGDYGQAIKMIRYSLNDLGNDRALKGEAHYWLAMLYERTGNSKEAESNKAKAKELWPEGEKLLGITKTL